MHELDDREDNDDEQQNTGGMPSGFTLQSGMPSGFTLESHLPKPFATKAIEAAMGEIEPDVLFGELLWENCNKCGLNVPVGETIELYDCNGETVSYACSFCADALQLSMERVQGGARGRFSEKGGPDDDVCRRAAWCQTNIAHSADATD